MQPTVVFDLDGTLVDSVPDLRASLNRLLASRGLEPLSASAVTGMVGDGAAALVRRGFAAREGTASEADIAEFLDDYGANAAVDTLPFPGTAETLARLRTEGWRVAVCTNKPTAPACKLLSALGLAEYLDAVGGGDSFAARKPDPAHLLATIAACGGAPGRSVMVGDHANDVRAAEGAGVPSIFALWGYGTEAMQAGATARAERMAAVPDIAARLLGRG